MPLIEAVPDILARTYAQSLFELAQKQGGESAIADVQSELEEILDIAREDPRFSEFLSSRILSAAARERSLEKIFRGRVSELTLKFLLVLNEKGRLGHLAPIIAAFDQMVQDAFGRVEVDVYTAAPLSGDEIEAIRQKLRSVLGKEPVVHPYTDGSMIGGIRLQIGDQLIDGSIASRLRRMRDLLASEGAAAVRARAARILSEDVAHDGQRNGQKH